AMDQTERTTEQVDSRRDERRTDARIVEDDRLNEVVEVALVIGRVDDAMFTCGRERVVLVLGHLLHFPEDRIERVLERPVHSVPLGCAKLTQVRLHAFTGACFVMFAVSTAQIPDDFFTRENGLRDLVEHGNLGGDYSILQTASANSRVV